MLMIGNELRKIQNQLWEVSLHAMKLLLLVIAGTSVASECAFAQDIATSKTQITAILGTVTDANGDPIPNATVLLDGPAGNRRATTTLEDGSFAMRDVVEGDGYHLGITAKGFADWSSFVSVQPGQQKSLGEIMLSVLSERTITVSYSPKQVAAQQLEAEEHQRVLGFIPNIFVTYEHHPEALTAKMKFHLTYKGLTHPTFFAFQGLWAGVEQAGHINNYELNSEGYAKRFAANLVDGTSESLFANAILPSLLHQDPRYFYRGSGTKRSRAWHAIMAPFVCTGDNGTLQPNYSQMGGSVIAASLSQTYYPASNRGPESVARSFGISMGLHVVLGVAQEFVLPKFTSKNVH